MKINIGTFLTQRAYLTPDREGLVCEKIRRTYRELNERANRLADTMKALGVGYGDRVGLLALNEPEYYDMYFGLGKIGAILVPINYRLAGPEIQFILSDCGAKVFVFGPEYKDIVDSIRQKIPAKELITLSENPPDWAKSYGALIDRASSREPEIIGGDKDTLTILYTSGTTGRPKGAELTHHYYFWNSINLMSSLGHEVGNNNLTALPLFHIGALAGPPWIVHTGGKIVLLRTLDPQRFLELLQEEKIHGFGSVPALLDILKWVPNFEKYDWSSVKVILVYAAPVPVALIKEYAAAGIQVRQ
ncbi:MAG TPA: AMP-binding protein, partial [Thermodesulfobacteriota bacterium]|nr:AMP-binding protein [Thermodesulfobacteriota bacterium]